MNRSPSMHTAIPSRVVLIIRLLLNGQRTLNAAVGLPPDRGGLLAGMGALLVLGAVGACTVLGLPLLLTVVLGLSLVTLLVVARSLAVAIPE